jgi:branched-chain amino acid transport system ATP-binding protein
LTKALGGLTAVNNLDLEVVSGQIFGLIGPNGAGKTTAFNLIAGFLKPTRGKMEFKGEEITNLKSHRIAERGIARTFQLTHLFSDMSVAENLCIAYHLQSARSFWGSIFGSSLTRRREHEIEAEAMSTLTSMG